MDNSIEAGSSKVDIVFRQAKSKSGRNLVDAVAFIDDGPGMLPDMIRYALCWVVGPTSTSQITLAGSASGFLTPLSTKLVW